MYQSLRLLLSTSQKTDTMGYSCDSCQYSCTRPRELERHNRTHTGEKPFTCESCQYSCTQICNLKQHKLFKHSDEKQISCNLCLFTCKTKGELKRHTVKINLLFVTEHKLINTSTLVRNLTHVLLVLRNSLQLATCHNTREHILLWDITLVTNVQVHSNKKCIFNSTWEHILGRSHTNKCKQCDKSFSHSQNLIRHRRTHRYRRETIPVWNMWQLLHTSKWFKKSYRTHTGEKPYCCDKCQEQFRFLTQLKKHRLMH